MAERWPTVPQKTYWARLAAGGGRALGNAAWSSATGHWIHATVAVIFAVVARDLLVGSMARRTEITSRMADKIVTVAN